MPQTKSKQSGSDARDPPPSLFFHPLPTASHAPHSGAAATAGLSPPSGQMLSTQLSSGPSVQEFQASPPLSRENSFLSPHKRPLPRLHTGDSARSADRTDALWAEMQATLEEAELSASGGTRVFGPEHDRKLAELRVAQIALAQAWVRSEADDAVTSGSIVAENETRNSRGEVGGMAAVSATLSAMISSDTGRGTADGTDAGRSTVGTGSTQPGSGGLDSERLGAKLEEETERDILLARNRREANDRYFRKVDQGVKDVVAKLEEVAIAMRAVEQETRGVWGEEPTPGSADS
ncbi:hypothetical protein GGR50DRAFT_638755 [Xylaria sp. CBS 124048]|nr:hypothetical protein GGR50DRAFT_638755 [Xylaria sp. CBS 124048]